VVSYSITHVAMRHRRVLETRVQFSANGCEVVVWSTPSTSSKYRDVKKLMSRMPSGLLSCSVMDCCRQLFLLPQQGYDPDTAAHIDSERASVINRLQKVLEWANVS